jgi:hypothetical protein
VSSGFYTTLGLAGTSASASYNANYADFDYEVKLWRNGCDTCANRIIVRGTPLPLDSSNHWYAEYTFQYNRDGVFSVYKRINGVSTALQEWTSSSAINQGDAWNVLRVIASGEYLYYYINGTLVWWGSDYSLSSGRVGIGMYRSTESTGDQLWVDWATLSSLSTADPDTLAGNTVSDEQQALNDAQNGQGGGNQDIAPSN